MPPSSTGGHGGQDDDDGDEDGHDGVDNDNDGSRRPFRELALHGGGGVQVRSKHIDKTLDPIWNEQLTIPVMKPKLGGGSGTSDQIKITAWDADGINAESSRQAIGVAVLRLGELEHWAKPAWINLCALQRQSSPCLLLSDEEERKSRERRERRKREEKEGKRRGGN